MLFNNSLRRKWVLSLKLSTTFDIRFEVTLLPFFIPDFSLINFELDDFTFKVLYWYLSYQYYIKYIHNTLTFPCEKSKMVSFDSSIIKNIFVFAVQSKFPVKTICCIALGSVAIACCLLKSISL